jgi:integrase
MPLFILLGLYTGRRKEAILSLRWPQVDLDAGLIDFEIAGRKRTKKKRGKVPIPPRLLPHLRRARKRGTDLGYVLHVNGERIGDIKKGFAAAWKRAGIEGVCPHTLKHTAITWSMQAGTRRSELSTDDSPLLPSLMDQRLPRRGRLCFFGGVPVDGVTGGGGASCFC